MDASLMTRMEELEEENRRRPAIKNTPELYEASVLGVLVLS
jgi:hypothetical protein